MVAVPKSGSSSGGGGGHGIPEGELLSTLALVGLIYFTAAGGAYGSESVINSVGPLPVIISHAIFPFCWSLPIGLATTELATAYPSDGGIAVWAALAFNATDDERLLARDVPGLLRHSHCRGEIDSAAQTRSHCNALRD